jgi:hypothetical protein
VFALAVTVCLLLRYKVRNTRIGHPGEWWHRNVIQRVRNDFPDNDEIRVIAAAD